MSSKNSNEVYGSKGRTNLLTFDPEDLKIVTDKKRKLYDARGEEPLKDGFVENLKKYGVLEPVIIWKNPESGEVEVIDGRQRVRGLREANKQIKKEGGEPFQIPATVRRATSEDQLVTIMVIANEIRKADTPTNRATKLQTLVDMGKTEEELAIICGCSKATIKNTLSLLETTAAVRDAVDAGRLPVAHAYELAKMHPADQKAKLDEIIKETGGSTGKTRNGRGRKLKEIVRGRPTMRGKKDILKKREEIEGAEDVKPQTKSLVLATFDWVLGHNKPLKELLS